LGILNVTFEFPPKSQYQISEPLSNTRAIYCDRYVARVETWSAKF